MAELYLQKKVPNTWPTMKMADRTSWLHGYDFDTPVNGTLQRETISGIEVFVECFNGVPEQYKKADAYEMTDLLFKAGWQKTGQRAYVVDYGRQRLYRKTSEVL